MLEEGFASGAEFFRERRPARLRPILPARQASPFPPECENGHGHSGVETRGKGEVSKCVETPSGLGGGRVLPHRHGLSVGGWQHHAHPGDARVLPVVASRASGGMHGCCRFSGRARSARLAPDPVAPHTTLSKKVEPHAHDVFRHWDACIPIP